MSSPPSVDSTVETDTGVDDGSERRSGPWLALQHRDFRLLLVGNLLSLIGTQMRIVAVSYQLYHLTHSALSLGALGLTRFIPLVALGLWAGLVADRHDRRHVLLISQSAMMLCSAGLCAMTWSGHATAACIYALLVLSSCASTFDLPARQALIPSLVPRHHLPNAFSLNVTGWQLAAVLGPTLGGFVIGLHPSAGQNGVALVYLIDALSFLAMILAVALIGHRHVPISSAMPKASTLQEAMEGIRFVFGNRLIMSSMVLDFLAMFFGAANTMLPIFADQIMHVNATGLGLMYAAPSAGAVLAGLVMASIHNLRRQGALLFASVTVYGICTAGFGASHWFILSLLLLAGTGAADTISAVIRNTIRQLNTPDALRGRMTAVNMLFFVGGPQLGEVEAGVAAHWMGVGPSVVLGGAACAVCVMWVALAVPEIRQYDR